MDQEVGGVSLQAQSRVLCQHFGSKFEPFALGPGGFLIRFHIDFQPNPNERPTLDASVPSRQLGCPSWAFRLFPNVYSKSVDAPYLESTPCRRSLQNYRGVSNKSSGWHRGVDQHGPLLRRLGWKSPFLQEELQES